jgi:acylpyruvate hydrolase
VRFASCVLDGRRFAALVGEDVARPLQGIAELGRETPSEVLADPPLSDERVPLASVRRVSGPAAIEAVAGYTAANDVTMRDYQYRMHQWLPGKNWARSTPLGPFLVTPDEVGDPHTLDISLELNGERMQAANTSQLIFDIPAVIATISEFIPLVPGDVVLTGTPSGVGYRRDPQVLLRDGDRVVVEIERVGRLENTVAAQR